MALYKYQVYVVLDHHTVRQLVGNSRSVSSSHSKSDHTHTSVDVIEISQRSSNLSSSGHEFTGSRHQLPHRSKRSARSRYAHAHADVANTSRSVETIVVIDSAMIDTHGQKNVSVYALTLLNMVS